MSSNLESVLIKKLIKDQGVPEAEAEEYISALKESEGESGIDTWMKVIGSQADTITKFPKEAQKEILTMLTADHVLGGRKKEQSTEDLATRIALIREAFKPDRPTADAEMTKKLDALEELVITLKEEKDAKVLEDLKKEFTEKLAAIEAKLSEGKGTEDTRDEITKLADAAEGLDQKRRALRRAIGVPEEESAPVTLTQTQMAEQLKKSGYKVEGPANIEDVEKRLRKEFEEERKKVREDAKKEADQRAKGIEILADLGGSIIETVVPLLGKGGGESAMAGVAKALKGAAVAGT